MQGNTGPKVKSVTKINLILLLMIIAVLIGFYACRRDHTPRSGMTNRTLVCILSPAA